MNKLSAYTVKQLRAEMTLKLAQCKHTTEFDSVHNHYRKLIVDKAIEWSKVRKLTPQEILIASTYGYIAPVVEKQKRGAKKQLNNATVKNISIDDVYLQRAKQIDNCLSVAVRKAIDFYVDIKGVQ